MQDQSPERLIPDPELRRIFGNVSAMCLWRWRRDGLLPQPRKINKRNYTPASEVAAAQRRMFEKGEAA
jgi:predicted DNA-binding transcriptional regulator AlpA